MSEQSCLNWLLDVKPSGDRIGPLVVAGLVNDSLESRTWNVPNDLNYQVCCLLTGCLSKMEHKDYICILLSSLFLIGFVRLRKLEQRR